MTEKLLGLINFCFICFFYNSHSSKFFLPRHLQYVTLLSTPDQMFRPKLIAHVVLFFSSRKNSNLYKNLIQKGGSTEKPKEPFFPVIIRVLSLKKFDIIMIFSLLYNIFIVITSREIILLDAHAVRLS